ncbi:MAG: GMC family oxidoreductase [Thermoleophilia bacterium]|nr:GMC family oxidoreductase [Thermoleophilia bacterium]
MDQRHYDYAVVGSGMGGATVAYELARRGKAVLLLEKGVREQKFGAFIDYSRTYGNNLITRLPRRTKEGTVIWRAFMAGGSTVVACGNGVRCLEAELDSLGVPLGVEMSEMETEMGVAPIARRLLGKASLALEAAASELGYDLQLMPKFISPKACRKCAGCVLGCPHDAKWTAVKQLDLLEQSGGEIWYGATVERVLVANGKATGVEGRTDGKAFRVAADGVIVAAGGLGTPVVLQEAGIDAGRGLFADLFVNTYATHSRLGQTHEPSMTMVGLQWHADEGFLISPHIAPTKPNLWVELGARGLRLRRDNLLGMMAKIVDERAGRVYANGKVSKPATSVDQAKLRKGSERCKEILIKAGADPKSIAVSIVQGAHPGGTAAIGEVVDQNLETKIAGLFVCDASVLPIAPGLPPMVTVGALGKYLAKKLAA